MKYLILTISLLLTAIVVYNMTIWIIITTQTTSFEGAKSLYLMRYPEFLRSAIRITLLDIVLSFIAFAGFLKLKAGIPKISKTLLNFLAALTFLLAAWQIFSLM